MSTITQQLSKLYKNPQIIEFIAQQIQQLPYKPTLKLIRKFVVLSFNLSSKINEQILKIEAKSVDFLLVLGRGYPYNPPRLHIKNSILSPGFNDCRDLLYDILNIQQWDYKLRLKEIQQKIPTFLDSLKPNADIYYISRLGQFHLNSVYPIDLIKQIQGNDIYFGFEYDSSSVLKMYLITLSSTHIAMFLTKQQPHYEDNTYKIPNEKEITSCMIVFYAEIGSLAEISVNRLNFNDVDLKFVGRKPHNMQLASTFLIKKLKLRKGVSLVQKLIRNIKYFNLLDVKLDLNPQTIQKEQKQHLMKIIQAQKQLDHKFNSATISQLNNCYQQIVQYYSINNIPYYEIFIEKIGKLYQRADVQLILNSTNKSTKIKDQKEDKEDKEEREVDNI